MKKINCIGDSHSSLFSGEKRILGYSQNIGSKHIKKTFVENDFFRIFHLGPYTAYNSNKKPDIRTLCHELYSENRDEYVLFSFGEIDMRCRVHRAENKKENLKKMLSKK